MRRGLAVPAATFGAMLAHGTRAAVPLGLHASVEAAAAGGTAASAATAAITDATMKTMLLVKVKAAAVVEVRPRSRGRF